MFHPIDGHDESHVRQMTSIAGRGYSADSHLFLSLPAALMGVAILACAWRSAGGVVTTLALLNGICALAAILGLRRVERTLRRLKLGHDPADAHVPPSPPKEIPHGP